MPKPAAHKLLTKRLAPLYAAAFFQGMALWYAIEKPFMKTIGFTNETIAIAVIIATVVMIAVNIPSGIIADKWSRKGALMLASVAMAISSVIGGFSTGFWSYSLAAGCWGVFMACYLGTYDSAVYDTLLEEQGNAEGYEHYYGRIQLFDGLALISSSLLSAVVAQYLGLRAAFFLTVPFSLFAILALAFFNEPKLHNSKTTTLLRAHIKDTLRAVTHTGIVLTVVSTAMLVAISSRLMFELDQLWLLALALPLGLYGPVNALTLSSISLGGVLAAQASGRISALATCLAAILGSLALLTHNLPLTILGLLVICTAVVIQGVLLNRYLHDALPSRIRASGSSVVGTAGYIVFLPVAYIFGRVSDQSSVFNAAWIVVALSVGAALGFAAILWRKRPAAKTAP
jgi:MFS family permease